MAIVGADESGGDKGGSLGTTHFIPMKTLDYNSGCHLLVNKVLNFVVFSKSLKTTFVWFGWLATMS